MGDDSSTLDIVGCPQCGDPAEVTDRFDLPSTDGPVEHLTVRCVHRHRFTMPAASLPARVATSRDEPGRWSSRTT